MKSVLYFLFGEQSFLRNLINICLSGILFILVSPTVLSQTVVPDADSIIYVKQGATGNGSSWANALGELADALVAAKVNLGSIKQIWVAKGTYKPLYSPGDSSFGINKNRNNTFLLVKNVQVYGGFVGSETSLTDRDWRANTTILSGDRGIANDSTDNCYSVVMSVDSVGSARLDGFTITNGYNFYTSSSITVSGKYVNCEYGGGFAAWHNSAPTITNCMLYNNKSTWGGGISTRWASPIITNCVITKNYANFGGAIRNYQSSPVIRNCTIDSNNAIYVGGIQNTSSTGYLPSIINCVISNNTEIRDWGSGVTNSGGSSLLINCTFYNNISLGLGKKLDLHISGVSGDTVTVYNSIIRGEIFQYDTTTVLKIQYSMVTGIIDTGNINSNSYNDTQVFTDAPAGDYTLVDGSPCIGAGNYAKYDSSLGTNKDRANQDRLFGLNIDMGAFERPAETQNIIVADTIFITYGDTSFIPATATSGLEVIYSSADTTIAKAFQDAADNDKWKIAIKKAGLVSITASQPGDTIYAPAPDSTFILVVQPKQLMITADSLVKIYGAADPMLTYAVTGFVNGDNESIITGALLRDTGENVGIYAIHQNTLDAGTNYAVNYQEDSLTIIPDTLNISADAQIKTYGDTDPILTYSATSFVNGDDESVLTGTLGRSPGENVGIYLIDLGTLSAGNNYIIDYTGDSLTITPDTLDIIANTQAKAYGDSDPILTYSATSFVNGDDESVLTGNLDRNPGEDVAVYPINPGTLSAGNNYIINYTGDSLTITPTTLNITADSLTKVYGAADPSLSYTINGFTNGDNESILTGSLNRNPGEDVATYPINLGALSAGDNYNINYTGSHLSIIPASLSIIADSLTKSYGTADPVLTYTASGFVNNDDESILTGALQRDTGESIGTYPIHIGGLNAGDNYTIQFTGANFTITSVLGIIWAQKNAGMKVYPNPGNIGMSVTITLEDNVSLQGAELQISELATGKILQRITEVQKNMQVTLPQTAGAYTFTLLLNNGQKATTRVIAQ